jgi:hypothetical protein
MKLYRDIDSAMKALAAKDAEIERLRAENERLRSPDPVPPAPAAVTASPLPPSPADPDWPPKLNSPVRPTPLQFRKDINEVNRRKPSQQYMHGEGLYACSKRCTLAAGVF